MSSWRPTWRPLARSSLALLLRGDWCMPAARIWTIGHSTRTFDEFLSLLRGNGISRLADIRTIPQSRRHPHFSRAALDARLKDEGIEYRHFPDLGGLRKP